MAILKIITDHFTFESEISLEKAGRIISESVHNGNSKPKKKPQLNNLVKQTPEKPESRNQECLDKWKKVAEELKKGKLTGTVTKEILGYPMSRSDIKDSMARYGLLDKTIAQILRGQIPYKVQKTVGESVPFGSVIPKESN